MHSAVGMPNDFATTRAHTAVLVTGHTSHAGFRKTCLYLLLLYTVRRSASDSPAVVVVLICSELSLELQTSARRHHSQPAEHHSQPTLGDMSMFWKPGTSGPGGVERGDDSALIVDPKLSNLPLGTQRKSLPIYRHRNSVLFALQKHRTVIIVGETGCGKTTQVSPQYADKGSHSCRVHKPQQQQQ